MKWCTGLRAPFSAHYTEDVVWQIRCRMLRQRCSWQFQTRASPLRARDDTTQPSSVGVWFIHRFDQLKRKMEIDVQQHNWVMGVMEGAVALHPPHTWQVMYGFDTVSCTSAEAFCNVGFSPRLLCNGHWRWPITLLINLKREIDQVWKKFWLVNWLPAWRISNMAGASLGQICLDDYMSCHTEIEVAEQTCYLTQSQFTDRANQCQHWHLNAISLVRQVLENQSLSRWYMCRR